MSCCFLLAVHFKMAVVYTMLIILLYFKKQQLKMLYKSISNNFKVFFNSQK